MDAASADRVAEENTSGSAAQNLLPPARDPVIIPLRIFYRTALESRERGILSMYRLPGPTSGEATSGGEFELSTPMWRGAITANTWIEIPRPASGEYYFIAKVPHHVLEISRELLSPELEEIVHSLTQSESIVCSVLTDGGAPIEGAEVRMLPSKKLALVEANGLSLQLEGAELQVEASDSQGIVRFASPSAALSRLHIIPPAPFAEKILWDVAPGAHVQAVLVQGASVIGHVTDSDGLPIQGVALAVYIKEVSGPEVPIGSTNTDSEGRYWLERMDPSAPCWSIFAEKPGWEMKRSELLHPRAGTVNSLDFSLRKATDGVYRILSAAGERIAGVGVHFVGTSSSAVPFSWTTDGAGLFKTGKHLVAGEEYSVQCVIGGIVRTVGRLTALESDGQGDPREIIAYSLGSLALAPVGIYSALDSVEVELVGTSPPMIVNWQPPFSPIWLPAGEYLVTGFGSGSILCQDRVLVDPLRKRELHLTGSNGRLIFEVPNSNANITVSILSHSNIVVWEQVTTGGAYTVQLPVGSYYFSCYSAEHGVWDTPMFSVTTVGTHYGTLDLAQLCRSSIQGSVVSASGEAISNALIVATSSDGYRSSKTYTEPNGAYALRGLPLGRYEVVCDLYQGTGITHPVIRASALLVRDGDVVPVNFLINAGAGTLVQVPKEASIAQEGFLAEISDAQYSTIDGAGRFRVYPRSANSYVGVCYTPKLGSIRVLAADVHAGTYELDLESEHRESKRVTVHGAIKKEWEPLEAFIEANGLRVGQGAFGEDGSLEVTFSAEPGLELLVIARSGLVWRFPLVDSREIALEDRIGPSGGTITVSAEDENGRVRFSVLVACCELRVVVFAGEPIKTACNRRVHDVLVDAPGYANVRQDIATGGNVTLKLSTALRRIDLSRAALDASALRITEASTGKIIVELPVQSEHYAQLPELPIGVYEFTALNSNSHTLGSWTLSLLSTGPASLRF